LPATPRGGDHCIFCLAGAIPILPPPSFAAHFHLTVARVPTYSIETWRLPAKTVDASSRPRGPPQDA
jgi:hypothetical protein